MRVGILGRTRPLFETILLLRKAGHTISFIYTCKDEDYYNFPAHHFRDYAINNSIPFFNGIDISTNLDLIKEYELNKLIYNSKFEFKPVVGKTYYLYEGNPQNFLSLINSNSWSKKFLGAFKLVSNYRWKKIK